MGQTSNGRASGIIRRARDEKGRKDFEAKELRSIIDGTAMPMRAMILLGVNCGLGNSDCGQLRFRNVDMVTGWLNYPRPKTSVARRCKLWPETVAAVQAAIDSRPEPKEDANRELVFITRIGQPWHKETADSPVSKEFAKVLAELKIKRPGVGFYGLRHTLETVGGEVRDQVALDHIMGHAPPANDIASVYREKIGDDRLEAIAEHVREWLWPSKKRSAK